MSTGGREANGHPALWIGLECTVNRVGDHFVDQCRKNGHKERERDLALFAELGAERIRYPFLWEWADPQGDARYDWSWADRQTEALKRHGLEPIVGFVHHGSGPRNTSLVDPAFPERLAHYAGEFAARYPWICDYTPVNEPLTTARFAGLYGFWYPHGKDDRTFVRALYQQVKGTVLAMEAIRRVQPAARLVQTEDMGRAAGTPRLQYQVDFENERRWLSYDLLAGRVDEAHPLYRYLLDAGLFPEELTFLREHACPPDVLGINHYLLSSRFLDHRLDLYPPHLHGGNGRDAYADVGAVDTGRAELPTPGSVLKEAWERYHRPVAITEVHVNGPREAQMRWLREVWTDASRLRKSGADVAAVTIWSLLGSYDWNSCCTRDVGFYESGVFDIRAKDPRPTALARMAQSLARVGRYEHPLLEQPGWWKLPTRSMFARPENLHAPEVNIGRPVLITGAHGTLGKAFARICQVRGIPHRVLSRREMDIADGESVRRAVELHEPWAIVNCAGYVRVETAERESERVWRENVVGAETLARVASERGIQLLTFSSDLVFDGNRDAPYLEHHAPNPLGVYGRSKAEAERRVLAACPEALVVRTSSFFGPWDEANFITRVLRSVNRGETVGVASDHVVSPTYVPDLVNACLDFLVDGERGIVHLTNRDGALSWADLARRAVEIANGHHTFAGRLDAGSIEGVAGRELGWKAPRPRYSPLASERANVLPSLEDSLNRYFHELEVAIPKATSVTGGAA